MIKKILYSNTSWSLISNGAAALLGFVNLALIARLFSQEDAGKWFMLLTVYTLIEMLRSGWVQTPFVRYFVVAKDEQEQARLTAASWQLLLLVTIIVSLIGLPVFYFIRKGEAFSLAQNFTVLWLFCALPYQLVQWQLQAKSLFKKLATIRIIFPLCFTVLLIAQSKFHFTIQIVVVLYALLQLACGFLGFLFGWLKIGNWKSNLANERKELSGFGKYSMLTMVASSLLRSSDQFIIASWLGPAAVAMYSLPQKLIEAIEIPVRSFASVAVPKATSLFQQKEFSGLRNYFYQQCGMLSAIIFPMLIILFSIPSFIVNLLGGSKYESSSLLLQIFCFYAALIPLDRFCGVLLDASNRPQRNTLKVVLMLVVNVAGDLLALWLGYGIYGVAASSTITFLFGVITGWIQLKDILHGFSAKLLWQHGVVFPYKNLTSKT